MAKLTNSFSEKLHEAAKKAEWGKEEIYKVGNFFRLISLFTPSNFEDLSVNPDFDEEDYKWYAQGAVYGHDGIPCLYAIEPKEDSFRFPNWVPEENDEWDDPRRCLKGGRLYVEPALFCDNHLSIGYWLGSVLKEHLQHPWLSAKGMDAAASELLRFYRVGIEETNRRCALFEKRVWNTNEVG